MSSPPRIRHFILGLLGIGLALLGQNRLLAGETSSALFCFALAVGIGTYALTPYLRLSPIAVAAVARSRSPVRWGVFAGALLAAVSCALLLLWRTHANVDQARASDWRLYVASIGFVLLAAFVLDWRSPPLPTQPAQRRTTTRQVWLWLVVILGIGAFLRLYQADSLPFGLWYDEAINGIEAKRILAGPAFYPFFVDQIHAPPHYLYLIVGAFQLFGVSVAAVRAVSVVMGVASIAAGYLCGREFFGCAWAGLLLAGFMALARWNINFSRIGMYNISTPLFALLTVGLLLRGLRRGASVDYLLAGLCLGLGFCFYSAFQIFVLVIIFFVLALLAHDWSRLRRCWPGLLVMGVTAQLVVSPVLLYAYQKPDVYFWRTRQTSLFETKPPAERLSALWSNTKKHLLMFNLRGDPNGRHNLPGEPMLDPVAGGLLILGAALCGLLLLQPQGLLVLLWLFGMLLAGVLSLDFEAPQSLRAIGALPAAYLLAMLPIFALVNSWLEDGGRYFPGVAALVPVLLLALSGVNDARTYFGRQAHDFAVWNAFSTPETLAAKRLLELDDKTVPYLVSYLDGHPAVQFITNNTRPYRHLESSDHLPLAWPADQAVELMLNQDSRSIYDEARLYYPNADFTEVRPPFGGPTVLYRVHLTSDDIQQVQGLSVSYFSTLDWSGLAAHSSRDLVLNKQWPLQAPLPLPFSAEWQGVLRIEQYGVHQFFLTSPAPAELYIDEAPLFAGQGELQKSLVLARGNHNLRLRAAGGAGVLRLEWQTPDRPRELVPPTALYNAPVSANGLLGRYYANSDWQGAEQFSQIDPVFTLYFHRLPLPLPFSIEWMGKLAAPEAGEYIFAVEALSSATLVIDGQAVAQTLQPNQSTEGRVTLTQGLHNITVRYQALDGHSHINLYWQPPGYGRQSLPAAVLFPPQGDHQRLQLPQLADLFVQSGATAPQASASVNDAGRVELPAEVRVVLDGLNQPRGVAVGDDGSIYIAETGGRRLFRIDEGGKIRSEFSGMPEALSEPFDLALDASGQVYLLDAGSGEILLFAADGRFLRYVGDERARFRHARGIAIDGQERLWVAHTPAGSLQRLSLQGEQLGAGVLSQEGDSQPVDVAVDAGDVVYVSDSGRNRLLLLSQNFQPLTSFDLTPANTVDGPHLAVSPNSLEGERPALYVSEPELGNLLKIAADSRQSGLYRLRNFGVQKPVGLAVDRQGRIWVADSAGGQVVVVIPVQ